jgi:hypothetical protein
MSPGCCGIVAGAVDGDGGTAGPCPNSDELSAENTNKVFI